MKQKKLTIVLDEDELGRLAQLAAGNQDQRRLAAMTAERDSARSNWDAADTDAATLRLEVARLTAATRFSGWFPPH